MLLFSLYITHADAAFAFKAAETFMKKIFLQTSHNTEQKHININRMFSISKCLIIGTKS